MMGYLLRTMLYVGADVGTDVTRRSSEGLSNGSGLGVFVSMASLDMGFFAREGQKRDCS